MIGVGSLGGGIDEANGGPQVSRRGGPLAVVSPHLAEEPGEPLQGSASRDHGPGHNEETTGDPQSHEEARGERE